MWSLYTFSECCRKKLNVNPYIYLAFICWKIYLFCQIKPNGLKKNPLIYAYEGKTQVLTERLQHQFIKECRIDLFLKYYSRKNESSKWDSWYILVTKNNVSVYLLLHTNVSATNMLHTFMRQLLWQCLGKIYTRIKMKYYIIL